MNIFFGDYSHGEYKESVKTDVASLLGSLGGQLGLGLGLSMMTLVEYFEYLTVLFARALSHFSTNSRVSTIKESP
jgi:hypothetical protein